MRISDWGSDVCSSDLAIQQDAGGMRRELSVRVADIGHCHEFPTEPRAHRGGGLPRHAEIGAAARQPMRSPPPVLGRAQQVTTSAEPRGGEAGVRTVRSWWSPDMYKKHKNTKIM